MLAGDHNVLHARILRDSHPLPCIVGDRIKMIREFFVLSDRNVEVIHDPLTILTGTHNAPVTSRRNGIESPVNEHPKAGFLPPGHAGLAVFRTFLEGVSGLDSEETSCKKKTD
jgi:hypothetical protein